MNIVSDILSTEVVFLQDRAKVWSSTMEYHCCISKTLVLRNITFLKIHTFTYIFSDVSLSCVLFDHFPLEEPSRNNISYLPGVG